MTARPERSAPAGQTQRSLSMIKSIIDTLKQEKGIAVIIVAAGLVTLLGFASLAVDVGLMYTARNELQNSVDAASLAGANTLGLIYLGMSLTDQADYVLTGPDEARIVKAAKKIAKSNSAANVAIQIDDSDVKIGTWNQTVSPPVFVEGLKQPTAVQVSASIADGKKNGPVATFFANAFSKDMESFQASATATASLNPPANAEATQFNLPIGMSVHAFDNDNCQHLISFNDTGDSCYGWTAFFEPDADAPAIIRMCFNLIANHSGGRQWLKNYFSLSSDPDGYDFGGAEYIQCGDKFKFNGGTLGTVFTGSTIAWASNPTTITVGGQNIQVDQRDIPIINPATNRPMINGNPSNPAAIFALFDFFRMRDGDNDNSSWTTVVPVYDEGTSGCGNPNKKLEIIGFARIKITAVNGPSAGPNGNTLDIEGSCELSVISGRGGGGQYGDGNVLGSIPNLVE